MAPQVRSHCTEFTVASNVPGIYEFIAELRLKYKEDLKRSISKLFFSCVLRHGVYLGKTEDFMLFLNVNLSNSR